TGKTRLALEVAADLVDSVEAGVCYVPLAHTDDADLVAVAIAQELGLHESGGQSLIDALKEYLREKRMLLLLDNFEHLLAAAPLVAELALACSSLKLLATSRAALRLYGEQEFGVPPLS